MLVSDISDQIILGIGDFAVNSDPKKTIKTYALGSCVSVVFYNPSNSRGGMIHIALSSSSIDTEKSQKFPGYFADTGIPIVVKQMRKGDPLFSPMNIVVYLIGGASMPMMKDYFSIGKKNIIESKRILSQMGFIVTKEDIGDSISRTVSLNLSNGRVTVSNAKLGKWDL